MKLHRFYIIDDPLVHDFELKDQNLLHQWTHVLRFKPGQEVILFDGKQHDRLYKIVVIRKDKVRLSYITDFERKIPKLNVYMIWSLLKKDKNDWVMQKCTELGVSHFVPLLADRSEKIGFNQERAKKIVIEATEQCGRSDIPIVREPMNIETALAQLEQKVQLVVAEQRQKARVKSQEKKDSAPHDSYLMTIDSKKPVGIFIGPEGGWSDKEKQLFGEKGIKHLNLSDFTLRAETAAVAAAGKLI